jgi:hypothetical protein
MVPGINFVVFSGVVNVQCFIFIRASHAFESIALHYFQPLPLPPGVFQFLGVGHFNFQKTAPGLVDRVVTQPSMRTWARAGRCTIFVERVTVHPASIIPHSPTLVNFHPTPAKQLRFRLPAGFFCTAMFASF